MEFLSSNIAANSPELADFFVAGDYTIAVNFSGIKFANSAGNQFSSIKSAFSVAKDPTPIIYGDGKQTRTFLYVDDCVEGTLRLFESDYSEPVNIGSDEQVSINQMIEIIEAVTRTKKLERIYQLDKPKGVRGRSSNNDLVKKVLNWSFKIKLNEGLKKTYDWIKEEMNKQGSNLSRFTKS